MATPKSEMRTGAEHRVAGARHQLDAVLAGLDDGAAMAEAMRTNDHAVARTEAVRLGRLHPEVAEAWTALDEAIKFLAFSLLTDMGNGTDD